MNIKKIIQEEINDFGWVDEINPTLFEYFENGLLEVGDVVTVRGETLDTDGIPVLLDKGKYLITHLNEFESSNFYKFIRSRVVFDNETQQKLDIYKETSLIEEDKGLEVLDHQRGGTMDMGDNVLREDDGDDFDWVRGIEGPKGEELRELLIGWLSGPFGRDSVEKQINGSTVYYTATSIDRDSYLSNLYKIVYSNGITEIVEIDDELNVFGIPWYAEKRITNDENTEWILVLSPQINESDDLDWIREVEPKRIEPCVKRGKCKEYVITGLESLSSNKVLEVLSAVNDLGWYTRDFEDWWDYEDLCYFYLERRGNCNWDDCELGYHEAVGEYYNYEEITPQDILNVVPQEKGLWGRYIDKLNESDDFDWVKEAKPTFGFFIDQFFRVGGYRAFMEALKDYFGIGKTVLLTGDLYLAGGTENSVIKLNQEPFRIMDVNQGKIRVKPIKLSKEHSDMWDSWIGEPYIELGDAKEDREIIIERPDKPILEQDDFDWIKDINPTKRDKAVFLNKEKYKTTTEYTDVEVGDKFIPSNGYKVWTVFSKLLRHGQVGSEKGWTYALGINDENGRHKVTYMSFMNHKDLGILNLTYRPWRKIVNINESDDLDWIRNINPVAFDDFINKAFYFDPIAEEGDEDYSRLVDKLNDLGFSPAYGTVSFVGEGEYIAGLFSYLDFDRNPKYVFTHDDFDTRTWDDYEQHIQGFALGESEARDDLEVVDARAFVTQFI